MGGFEIPPINYLSMNKIQCEKFFNLLLNSKFLIFILISLINFLLYIHTLKYDFTSLDDYDLILNKHHILSKPENISLIFKTNFFMSESGSYYRPLVSISFMIDTLIGGKNPLVFHLSNLIYHIIASFLMWLLLKFFGIDKFKSLMWSLLFAVHPALVQAVVWIPGRNDSLLFIFVALVFFSLNYFLKINSSKRFYYLALTSFSFLLSLLTKENSLVVIVLILFYLMMSNREKLNFPSLIPLSTSLIVPVLIYAVLRFNASVAAPEFERLTLNTIDYLKGFINYLGKIFLPFNLSVLTMSENINLIYGIYAILIIIILASKGIINKKVFLFGWIWFILFLVSGMTGLTGFTNFLDHRLYVPMFGLIISLNQMKLIENLKMKFPMIMFIAVLAVFSYLNIEHSKNFENPLVFYKSAVDSTPNSFFTHRGLANVYHRLNQLDLAERHYSISLNLNPDSYETLMNLGLNFKKKGMIDTAKVYLLKAAAINPDNDRLNNNLGNLYIQLNDLKKAEFFLKRSIRKNNQYFEAFNNLGVLYAREGNDSLALQYFQKAVEINPEFAEAYFNLALFYFNKNDIQASKYFYNLAIKFGFPQKNILTEKLVDH